MTYTLQSMPLWGLLWGTLEYIGMPSFSQRIGRTPAQPVLQLEDMSIELRNSIWNVICESIPYASSSSWDTAAGIVARDLVRCAVDTLPRDG